MCTLGRLDGHLTAFLELGCLNPAPADFFGVRCVVLIFVRARGKGRKCGCARVRYSANVQVTATKAVERKVIVKHAARRWLWAFGSLQEQMGHVLKVKAPSFVCD